MAQKTVNLKLLAEYTPEPDPPEASAEFSLDFSSYTVSEGLTQNVKILRTVRTDQVLDIDWAAINVSVLPVSGTERFQIGETERTVQVTAQQVDSNEQGTFEISNPQYVSGPVSDPILSSPFSALFFINDTDSESDYPMLRNITGWSHIANRLAVLEDVNDQNYLIARVTSYMKCQVLLLGSPSERPAEAAKWLALKADNPLFHGVLHLQPAGEFPAYRTGTQKPDGYWYRMVRDRHNRDVGACMLDTDNAATQFNGNETTGFTAGGGTVFAPNWVTPEVRDDWAELAADFLTGSNLSGYGFGDGTDLSDFMTWFHDSTNIQPWGYDKKLMNPYAIGQIVSVDAWGDSTNSHLRKCTINNQPGSGVENKPIYFFPHNDPKGFIGYVIQPTLIDPDTGEVIQEGYVPIGGGQAELNLYPLPNVANGISQLKPAANWRYTVSNPDSTPDNIVDWNADGTPEGKYEGASIWIPAWVDIWTRIESKIGKGTAIGFNSTATSWDVKESNGWPSPHEFTGICDNPSFENGSRAVGFVHNDAENNYNIALGDRAVVKERVMFGIYYHRSLGKTPNAYVANRPYRPFFECLAVGGPSDITAYDANMMRFLMACTQTVGDMSTGGTCDIGTNGILIDEYFIDLDTNYSYPEPIADYDDAGGPIGSSGYPVGLTTMRTPTCGEAIYVRRVGNWLMIINMADSTRSDYPSLYSPSHLPGGYTPQSGNDEITAANWATIIATYLQPGELLRRFNPATYVNARVTSWLRNQSPNHWGSGNPSGPYSYGPRQPHPNDNDGIYTLATTPAIARDDALNTGANVNTNQSFFIGPIQAQFLEIYTP